MSKVISFGYTDTPISGVTSLELPRGRVNFGADFAVKVSKPSEVVLTNVSSPRDRAESFRFQSSTIQDVYSGLKINKSVQAPSLSGSNILIQLTEIATVTDTEDSTYRVDIPLSYHMVIKVPALEELTENHVLAGVGRLVSGLFETGSETNDRLKKILRGSLIPQDLR